MASKHRQNISKTSSFMMIVVFCTIFLLKSSLAHYYQYNSGIPSTRLTYYPQPNYQSNNQPTIIRITSDNNHVPSSYQSQPQTPQYPHHSQHNHKIVVVPSRPDGSYQQSSSSSNDYIENRLINNPNPVPNRRIIIEEQEEKRINVKSNMDDYDSEIDDTNDDDDDDEREIDSSDVEDYVDDDNDYQVDENGNIFVDPRRQIRRRPNGGRNGNGNRNGNRNRKQQQNDQTTELCRTRIGGYQGVCLPIGHCYYLYGDLRLMSQEICSTKLNNGQQVQGICCPVDIDFTPNRRETIPYRLRIRSFPKENLRGINRQQIERAIRQADDDVVRFFRMEQLFIGQMNQIQIAFTPAHFLQVMFGPANQNHQLQNLWGFRALQVTRSLGKQLNLSPKEMRDGLSQLTLYGTSYEQYCLREPKCSRSYRYRTIDGSCNNLQNPLWGKSLSQYYRLLPPEYSDGISELRDSVTGSSLPSPRIISTNVLQTSSDRDAQLSQKWNVMFMQWGQFIDHDMTLGSSTRASTGEGLLCCNRTNAHSPVFHPACRPIYIPSEDAFYSNFNRKCNNFVRNAVGPKNDCSLGYREQTNVVTSFIDGSMIYGSDFNRSRLVRTFEDGLLETQSINGKEWLPLDTMNNSLACSITRQQRQSGIRRPRCVFAGDVRVNQQPGLIALQLMFLREHNRLARSLKRMNPRWNDEKLYQEARRIVSAQVQHITYNEYLPEALGRNVMRHFGISLQPTGHCLGYDPTVNPSILNEFASAAYRWHTLVQKHYHLKGRNGRDLQRYEMHRIFNNPTIIYEPRALDQAIRGVLGHPSERFDPVFTEDIKNLLFAQQNTTRQVGMDLMSINIQRGRDHGMPTYNQIRILCGLPSAKSFRQLSQYLSNPDDWQRLQQVYSHVDDIDFWVGGNLERVMDEGILGPTFSCIVGEQFRRLKYGDRFWYENGEMEHSFNEKQLTELRKVTLAGIICQNSDDIQSVQPLAMLSISQQNPQIDCSLIEQMDLSPWRNLSDDRDNNRPGGAGGGGSTGRGNPNPVGRPRPNRRTAAGKLRNQQRKQQQQQSRREDYYELDRLGLAPKPQQGRRKTTKTTRIEYIYQ